MMFVSYPEPWCDIAAQLRYMLDPANRKDAVFVAAGNEDCLAVPPQGVMAWRRVEGTLYTTSREKLRLFATAQPLEDSGMAALLGYPQDKITSFSHGPVLLAQILDADGHVVKEAVISRGDDSFIRFAATSPVPAGGTLTIAEPGAAFARRARLRGS